MKPKQRIPTKAKLLLLALALTGAIVMQLFSIATSAVVPSTTLAGTPLAASPQFSNGKFHGPASPPDMSMGAMAANVWEYLTNDNLKAPAGQVAATPVELTHFTDPDKDQLSATWLGHASLMINVDGYRLLTDPVFERRVSVIGPTRFNGDLPIQIDQLPVIDAVIISHDHYDHLNKSSVQQLSPKTRQFLVPLGVGARLIRWGIPANKIVELDWWEEHRIDDHIMVAATPAQHFSGRGLTDRDKTLWASWVVRSSNHALFFSGDSGYFDGYKKIGDTYGPFDITFIECGAYDKAWAHVHMFPEQTVQAHLDLRGRILHPIHWGTFTLALHPWYEPMERATAAAQSAGVSLATPMVGQTTVLGQPLPNTAWWQAGQSVPYQANHAN